jgi:stalled ribosome rescue protein Dom34
MKCSPYRKRYVLLEGNREELDMAVKDIYRNFKAKEKFKSLNYSIILGDQFSKDYIASYVRRKLPNISIITVSGTIKKCKEKINPYER